MRRLSAVVAGVLLAASALAAPPQTATFASGCFWCTESDFEKLDGVLDVISGYIGGRVRNPSYKQVSAGGTGHAEAVQIRFDPDVISYEELLAHYWRNVDPTVENRQFCDKGSQYRSAIFYHDAEQQRAALASLEPVREKFGQVYTQIVPATTFYPAEDYHQDYYKKNPIRYRWYRSGCGRDARLKELWGDEQGH